MVLPNHDKGSPLFGKDAFVYDAAKAVYTCPRGEVLRRQGNDHRERSVRCTAKPSACNACSFKIRCTKSAYGDWLWRSFEEEYLGRVRGYRNTESYRKAIRKRPGVGRAAVCQG